MPREDARTKGNRYLVEGRLWIRSVTPEGIRASCRGVGEFYQLGFGRSEGWWCSCPAKTRCAHLWALMTVTVASGAVRSTNKVRPAYLMPSSLTPWLGGPEKVLVMESRQS
jgi:hypothetical protein